MPNLSSDLYNLFDIAPVAMLQFLQWLAQASALPHDLHLLDVGCGPGRLLRPAAALGWRVTGLEPDAAWAQFATEQSADLPAVSVQQGGFADINMTARYDFIAALNGPYAYLLDIAARQAALAAMFAALKPGGVLLLDFANFAWVLRHYRQPEATHIQHTDGHTYKRVIRHQVDWHTSTITHIDTFYRNDQYLAMHSHTMGIITVAEVLHLVAEAGFCNIRTYNHWGARQSQRITGRRIILSAQRPVL